MLKVRQINVNLTTIILNECIQKCKLLSVNILIKDLSL